MPDELPPVEQIIAALRAELATWNGDLTPALELLPGEPFYCKRCGAKLGVVIEVLSGKSPGKRLLSSNVAWGNPRYGECVQCGAKIYFRG